MRWVFLLCGVLAVQAAPAVAQQGELKVGLDVYAGLSDIPGVRRPTDQLWAGREVFTPSVAYGRWSDGKGVSARLALGVGEATLRKPRLFPQPVEAWGRKEFRGGALTLGRFFAPFGQQEWQYEARDGVLFESGRLSLAAQARGLLYGRWTAPATREVSVGVSAASGRGFSYGSAYNKGAGVDLTASHGPWQLRAESDRFFGPQNTRFRFDFARLDFAASERIQPFVSRYAWADAQEGEGGLGPFKSEMIGVAWTLSPSLSLEAGVARTSGRRVAWAQARLTREW